MKPPSPPPTPAPAKPPITLKASTKLLLVLLQLAIGWHFFYEGVWKLQNPTWSSKGYLKNSAGPVALPLRWSAGDPDVFWQDGQLSEVDPTPDLVARLTPSSNPGDTPTENNQWAKFMPTPVQEDWQAYFDAFVKHYNLEGKDLDKAKEDFAALQAGFVEWLVKGTAKAKRANFTGESAVPVQARLKDYLAKLEEAKALPQEEDGTFHIVSEPKTQKAGQEAVAIRKELEAELDARTDLMKRGLREQLTYEQRRMAEVPAPAAKDWGMPTGVPAPPQWIVDHTGSKALPMIDNVIKWSLLVIGAGLLLGLFSRTSCLLGAVLLLAFYISSPPFPWLPESPMTEGHYRFINKNLIEMIALLALATTQPGTRYGLDVWLRGMWRAVFGTKKPKPVGSVPPLPSQTARPAPVPPPLPTYKPPTKRS